MLKARYRLGDTLAELNSRAHVKRRIRGKVAGLRHTVGARTPKRARTAATRATRAGLDRPLPTGVVATAVVVGLAYLTLGGRRKRK
ncbi:hypothetical protein [Streptomyces sp. 184]|uniref:hypothetical protein n=1 Tax=Streptomyces sp. 184 TaxID=1827526 RepID=UPI0038922126